LKFMILNIFILARGEDVDNWVNILVVIMLAVFWLVGGLVKAIGQKSQKGRELQFPRKPPTRPQKAGRAIPRKPPPVPSSKGLQRPPGVRKEPDKASQPMPVAYPSVKQEPKRPIAHISEPSSSIFEILGDIDLRRAILYYEILGKPLGLRGPHTSPW
jgi:hypothetical protein